MKMQKRQFRIGELATYLNVEKFVIRFWEKEFDLSTERSEGGQRFYYDKDIEKFLLIKELLYQKGFTIAGAKQQLKVQYKKRKNLEVVEVVAEDTKIIASQKTTLDQEIVDKQATKAQLEQQIIDLQKKLMKLRELL